MANGTVSALGILAGTFIGTGAVLCTSITRGLVAASINCEIIKLVGSLTPSLGLIVVILAGAELFADDNSVVTAFASGEINRLSCVATEPMCV